MKPIELNLFGDIYTIKYISSIESDSEDKFYWGVTDHIKKEILIATKDKDGNLLSKETMRITLLHELMHFILCSGMYINEDSNEPLIEWCARCLNQIHKQKLL